MIEALAAILTALAMLTTPSGAPEATRQPAWSYGRDVAGRAGAPLGAVGTVEVGGLATWYEYHQGQAAAGPTLRSLLGSDWRGETVTVSANGRSVTVRLTDWCACGDRNGVDTLIDLDDDDFARLAPKSRGVINVTVEVGGKAIPLPPTDTVAPSADGMTRNTGYPSLSSVTGRAVR